MRAWKLSLVVLLASGGVAAAAESSALWQGDPYRAQRLEITRSALDFLSRSANPDGSFGASHRRLQTSLVLLAFLAAGERPGEAPYGQMLTDAYRWLLSARSVTGFAGDKELPTESHAVAGLAFTELTGMGANSEDDRKLREAALAALQHTLDTQDKAFGGRYNGGWKAEARDKLNDRKASAWQMVFIKAAGYSGARVPAGAVLRGTEFMKGSFKGESEKHNKRDVGGFSYDAEGLPVRSISAAGTYCMEQFHDSRSDRTLGAKWLAANPPVWTGPHFYFTEFFAVRALRLNALSDGGKEARDRFDDYFRKVTALLREQQRPDGSFALPPGNAEYTKQMGPVYATAMAVLILNCDRNLLPSDMAAELPQPAARISEAPPPTEGEHK
jgi:hypothetical protein